MLLKRMALAWTLFFLFLCSHPCIFVFPFSVFCFVCVNIFGIVWLLLCDCFCLVWVLYFMFFLCIFFHVCFYLFFFILICMNMYVFIHSYIQTDIHTYIRTYILHQCTSVCVRFVR